MRDRLSSPVLVSVLAFCFAGAAGQSSPKPIPSPDPLTAEQMSIYRQFLADYDNGAKAVLNVAQITRTFEADDGDLAGCMKTFNKDNSRAMIVHSFQQDSFPADKVRLVDPEKHVIHDPGTAIRQGQSVDDAVKAGFAEGLFTFSEIVFDSTHTYAALDYSFHCGSLCGHGGTVVFHKVGEKWKKAKVGCGSWIS
jgi:hypothetical protein